MRADIPPGLRFAILDRVFKKRLDQWAAEMGLTAVQMRVLLELGKLEDSGVQEVNQRNLEEAEHVSHPTMTEIIKRLEKKGFVTCTPSAVDRRYKKITSIDKAICLQEGIEAKDAAIFKDFCKGFSAEEVEMLNGFLDRILDNIAEDSEDHK